MPIWKRKWFRIGLGVVLIGLFTTTLSRYERAWMLEENPDLGLDRTPVQMAEQMQQEIPEDPLDRLHMDEMTEAQKNEFKDRTAKRLIYGNYGMYITVGYVFMVIGLLLMGLSFKETQVPDYTGDLEPDPEETTPPNHA